MQGRRVLITGGARGMGAITARALAARGAELLIADWEGEQGERTAWEIRQAGGQARFFYCNLAEPDSVRALTAAVGEAPLQVLINNAGITYPRRQESSRGVEMHFAACYLGHVQLTRLLLDNLRAGAPARILFVASEGHKACQGLDFDDLNNLALWRGQPQSHTAAFMAYARAKLCMLYAMQSLAEELSGSGVSVNALSPGYFINTGIHREMRGIFRWGAALVFGLGGLLGLGRAERAARGHIAMAADPEWAEVNGGYFQASKAIAMSPAASDAAARQKLWALTDSLIGDRP